eukprot:TRINITY_DN1115_c0_g1_i3.p1 TRINITY_DN1115_c0_g1~~TRINITY_DN1115_c0_g1_i3.p1  ORF type:complete len:473 (+),score=35.15 TRINITY_DN1115_c0_g1_i3:145-1419(+)
MAKPQGADIQQELLPKSQKKRHGTWYYAFFHFTAALLCASALSLPWAFSYLGWILGSLALLLAFATANFSASLLTTLHEQGDLRFDKYTDLGRHVLGKKYAWVVPTFHLTTCIGTGIVFILTGAQNARQVYYLLGGTYETTIAPWVVGFGLIQIALVQLPDFHSLTFVSISGTFVAIGYHVVAVISAANHIEEDGYGEVVAQRADSTIGQVFGYANGVGSVLFAVGGLSTVIEIQSTLPSPSQSTMHKGVSCTYTLAFFLYFAVSISGYLAFGTSVSDNILLSTNKPPWMVAFACGLLAFHVIAGYQIYTMVVFMLAESKLDATFECYKQNWLSRLVYRTLFVLFGMMVAIYIPFFGALNGFVGAAGMAMLTFILPPILTLVQFKSKVTLSKRIACYMQVIVMASLAMFAIAGTLYNIVDQKTK